MGTLTLDNVCKSFGTLEVLHGITLDVAEGEFIALVGPSGCGKSTLLRMIAGLEAVTKGDILLDGRRINEAAPKDRDVAMVFQSYALYPHMTVRQNMSFALEQARMPKAEIRKATDKAAAILGLEALMERKPRELSGGQMQRVAMGRAIVRDPAIFLFDEPLSNLDAKLRVKVRGEIQALHAQLGTTTVYVTHDQVEAMTLAGRLVVMRDGYVEQIGTPLELYDRPATEFVAGFIGAPPMNLLPGTGDGAGGLALTAGPMLACGAPDGAVTLGVRPEHLEPAADGWPAVVDAIEVLGHESHVTAHIGDLPVIYSLRGRNFPKAGDRVHLRAPTEHRHWFRDGKRLGTV